MESRITCGDCRIEQRAFGDGVAIGYAAVFHQAGDPGTEYKLAPDTVERIDRGAFAASLSRPDDVRALFNHDSNNLLGRTTSGTLRLSTDSIGLKYEISLGDETLPRSVAEMLTRGDLTGSSFAFIPDDIQWLQDGARDIRLIKSMRLYDVGPVTFPAYGSTSASVRTPGQQPDREREAMKKKARARLVELSL